MPQGAKQKHRTCKKWNQYQCVRCLLSKQAFHLCFTEMGGEGSMHNDPGHRDVVTRINRLKILHGNDKLHNNYNIINFYLLWINKKLFYEPKLYVHFLLTLGFYYLDYVRYIYIYIYIF